MGIRSMPQVFEERVVNTHVLGAADSECREPKEDVVSMDEKKYQQLIIEKLKAAAEWDVRDSKLFALR